MTYVMSSPMPNLEQILAAHRDELVTQIQRHALAYARDPESLDFHLGLVAAIHIIQRHTGDTPTT